MSSQKPMYCSSDKIIKAHPAFGGVEFFDYHETRYGALPLSTEGCGVLMAKKCATNTYFITNLKKLRKMYGDTQLSLALLVI